ncbi:amidase [Peribacillus deserti]|uniref:Amidase n=2 Tax=Peribacillus deserti TaxID=673318 RepID=A0A2N5MBG4_9BACI|nr:amidase [Peribacillus deserti]
MPAKDLAAKIRNRELSALEVTEAFISRIEERDKSLNSFVYFGYEDALNNARQADRALQAGDEAGIFHGVPSALKDLFGAKPGWISTFGGLKVLKDNVVNHYCAFGERYEKAGGVLLGKTNSPLLGASGMTDNELFGPTRNPFDLTRNPGGSSGGAAAAVADGLLPIAQGSDSGGSTRIPAAWCGLFGFKPSGGRVPFLGRPDGFRTFIFSTEGVLTRNVEDAALGLSVLTGYDDRDPYSVSDKVDFMSALHGSMKGKKIAYSRDFGAYPVDQRVANSVENAVKLFQNAGAIVEEVDIEIPYHQRELSDLFFRTVMRGYIPFFESLKNRGYDLLKDYREDLTPAIIEWMEKSYQSDLRDMYRDQIMRTEMFDAIQKVFRQYDLLVTPTAATLPQLNGPRGKSQGPVEINGVEVDPSLGWAMTYFTNFTGHPSASIPAGLEENLPVGLQIIGKRYGDADVLTASAVFEQLKPWQYIYDICKQRPLEITQYSK